MMRLPTLPLLYTVVNIPYCALGGVITNDPTQRLPAVLALLATARHARC
jgi:Na+/melibiose symporter-like transporter